MVRVLIDQVIAVRVHIFTVHALEVRARNGMPEVADDGVDEERFANFVPIETPRVRRAMADGLDNASLRMVAPDAAVHHDAFVVGSARPADARLAGNADTTTEPAVGAALEPIGGGVSVAGGGGKAAWQHFRAGGGHAVS